ncbi:hypothetical protein LTR86_002694 [Recurvomyces mirabilis]|nr:hypothetical protein LTR86_002694 [Recurvomyces mirabilis]
MGDVYPGKYDKETIQGQYWGQMQDLETQVFSLGPYEIPIARQRWIRFCYETQETADKLNWYTLQAVARWLPAYTVSSLTIQPAPECHGKWNCICSADMPEDTLHIIDMNAPRGTEASKDAERKATSDTRESADTHTVVCESLHALDHCATVGYALKDNWIKMNIRLPLNPEKADGRSWDFHQRPDAFGQFNFHCKNVDGYAEAESRVGSSRDGRFEGMDLKSRMDLVCKHRDYAMDFFPRAAQWVQLAPTPENGYHGMALQPQKSSTFDFRSIMIYDSWDKGIDMQTSIEDHVLVKKDMDRHNPRTGVVFSGGSQSPIDKSISGLDILQVARLYESTAEDVKRAERMARSGWWPYELFIREDGRTLIGTVVKSSTWIAKGGRVEPLPELAHEAASLMKQECGSTEDV